MKHKKLLAIVFSFVMLFALGTAAVFAEETATPIQPRFTDFANVWTSLADEGNGLYQISGGATADTYSDWVEVTVTIQAYYSGEGWKDYGGWVWTASGQMSAAVQASRYLNTGTYRVHTVATATRNGVLLETVEAYGDNTVVVRKGSR